MSLSLRILDRATQGLNLAGSALILVLMLLIGADVIGRAAFGTPISGVPEIVTMSIVAIVFLQIPQALRAGRMTRSDGLGGWLARRYPAAGRALDTLFDLIAIAVTGVIVHGTWPIFARAWQRGEFVGAVGDFTAPVWPVKLTILVGGGFLIAQFAARIARRHS
ncbi:MAG: TRAP transporter small permease subunit [Rhodobacteraceae bacterium]|nr:TRAP transporter small permease subunit [Paracoccaceae bacterium]